MKIYPNKLFHCKISLLPFFLTHSFPYFSSYKQFFHQPQKSSNPIQSPNHLIFPPISQSTPIHPYIFLQSPTPEKKSHKAHPTLLPLPLNSGNAQKIANSFPPPWNGNQLDPTAHHWISHFFFFLVGLKLFLVALVYLTLACQLLSTPFSIVEKKKRKKRDVSTRERVRASVVVGWKYGSPLITSYVPRNFCSYTPRFNPCFPLRARCTTSRAHWSRELVWAPVQFVAFYLHTCKWYLR